MKNNDVSAGGNLHERIQQLPENMIPVFAFRAITRILPLISSQGNLDFWKNVQGDNRVRYLASALSVLEFAKGGKIPFSDTALSIVQGAEDAYNVSVSSGLSPAYYVMRALYSVLALNKIVEPYTYQKIFDEFNSKDKFDDWSSFSYGVLSSTITCTQAAYFHDFSLAPDELNFEMDFDIRQSADKLMVDQVWTSVPDWYVKALERFEFILEKLPRSDSDQIDEWRRIDSGLEMLWREAGVSRPSDLHSSIESSIAEKRQKDNSAENISVQLNYSSTHQFHSENPSATDKLNRQKLVDALAVNLKHSTNHHHRAIGLLGEWGAGKSTVLELLKQKLKETHKEQSFIFGEFNAWAYEHTDNIQAGVAQEMINALTRAPESVEPKAKNKPEPENKKAALSFSLIWNKLFSLIHKLPDVLIKYLLMDVRDARAGIVNFVARQKLWMTSAWLAQRALLTLQFSFKIHLFEMLKIFVLVLVAIMPWFSDWFQQLIEFTEVLADKSRWIWAGGVSLYTLREFGKLIISPQAKELLTYLRLPSYAEHLGKIPVMRKHISTLCELRLKEKNGKTPRLLFVVDDLDRCSPEAIVKVLEAVRLVLDLENVIVLIAIDQHIALAALSKHFNDFAVHHKLKNSHAIAREYLSKVINLPIVLTAPSGDDVQVFMVDLWKDMLKDSTVGASDAGREDSIDNTPKQVTSETNLPAVDSKALPDDVPVADGSPNSDFLEDLKPTVPEGDQQPRGEINPIKALSPEQQQSFIYWVNYFELTNPRQLKRLNNSYDLMRSYFTEWDKAPVAFSFPNENSKPVYPMLLTLVLMEYLNSFEDLEARGRIWKKLFSDRSLVKGSAGENITIVDAGVFDKQLVGTDFIKAYREILELQDYKDLPSKVEAFVLPAMV